MRRVGVVLSAAAVLAALGSSASAAVLTVNSLGDDETPGDGLVTLREAIRAANNGATTDLGETADAGHDELLLTGLGGSITLASSLPPIATPMTITGPGRSLLTINGANQFQIFFIRAEATISDVTLANGRAKGGDGADGHAGPGGGGAAGMGGAAFINQAPATFIRVEFTNNRAIGGAGGNAAEFSGSVDGGGGGGVGEDGHRSSTPTTEGGNGGHGGPFGGLGGVGSVGSNGGNGGEGAGGAGGSASLGAGQGGHGGFGGGGGGGNRWGGNGGFGGGGGGSLDWNASFSQGGMHGGRAGRWLHTPSTTFYGSGAGGGAGGLGGAIFVRDQGSLDLQECLFTSNVATGGPGGTHLTPGRSGLAGEGKGGAIYIMQGASASAAGTIFNGNNAGNAGSSLTDNGNIYGELSSPIESTGVVMLGWTPTNEQEVMFAAYFNKPVKGLNLDNFTITPTMPNAQIIEIIPHDDSGLSDGWTIIIDVGEGDGQIGLELSNVDGITGAADEPVYTGNLPQASDYIYTIDRTAPYVQSVEFDGPALRESGITEFRIRFSEVLWWDPLRVNMLLQRNAGSGFTTVTGGSSNHPDYDWDDPTLYRWSGTGNLTGTQGRYRLTVRNAPNGFDVLEDEAGNIMESPYTIEFEVRQDGITTAIEDAGPNSGDGNYDGILDSLQPNVATLRHVATDTYVTVSTDNGRFTDVSKQVTPAGSSGVNPANHPQGFLHFTLRDIPSNADEVPVVVDVRYSTPLPPEVQGWFKYGPRQGVSTPTLYGFPFGGTRVAGAEFVDAATTRQHFRLRLRDGHDGDNDLLANGVIVDPGGPGVGSVLAVTLESFAARPTEDAQHMEILWRTFGEVDNAGFNVYRAIPDGENRFAVGEKLNSALIPAAGDAVMGADYTLLDPLPLTDGEERWYFLEDVDLKGITTLHGPALGLKSASRVEEWMLH